MRKKTILLGIDLQNDFTTPQGSFYISGAERDTYRIYSLIEEYGKNIDSIVMTLDTYQPIHITNQTYWKDQEGYPPRLYCQITSKDVKDQMWIPKFNADTTLKDLIELETKNKTCTILPTRCIAGSWGWALSESINKALQTWCIQYNKTYGLILNNYQQTKIHHSIFNTIKESQETKTDFELLNKFNSFDQILIVGQPADICVINSLTEMISLEPEIAKKTIVLTDCMSWADKNNQTAMSLLEYAYAMGVKFMTKDELIQEGL